MSRREFAALTLAAGMSATTAGTAAARPRTAGDASEGGSGGAATTDTDVVIKTPSGSCDAALVHPQGDGHWPAVILFTDIFGLRPTMRGMAARLAADGFTVLVPNPYYRSTRAPGLTPDFDFASPSDRAKLDALRAPLTSDAVMADSVAYVEYLAAHPSVDAKARMGVMGYCMGGPMTMQAAAANPGQVAAGASFHGGGLVTGKADSPHLLAPKIRAQFYFAIAASDDDKQPDAKTQLAAAFRASDPPAVIEVFPGTVHGWCVKDMPLQNGKPIYDAVSAERAWRQLLALYKRAKV